jgi:hypothetical protein
MGEDSLLSVQIVPLQIGTAFTTTKRNEFSFFSIRAVVGIPSEAERVIRARQKDGQTWDGWLGVCERATPGGKRE